MEVSVVHERRSRSASGRSRRSPEWTSTSARARSTRCSGENGAGKTTLMNILYGMLPRRTRGRSRSAAREVQLPQPPGRHRGRGGDGSPALHARPHAHRGREHASSASGAARCCAGETWRQCPSSLASSPIATASTSIPDAMSGSCPWASSSAWRSCGRSTETLASSSWTSRPPRSTPAETERLFPKLRALAAEGASIVFITHHLEDVSRGRIASRCCGAASVSARCGPPTSSAEELARMMVGRDVRLMQRRGRGGALSPGRQGGAAPRRPCSRSTASTRAATGAPRRSRTSPSRSPPARSSPIAGVEGNGQPELEEVLFGLRTPEDGTVPSTAAT